jgi:hypothetical protein
MPAVGAFAQLNPKVLSFLGVCGMASKQKKTDSYKVGTGNNTIEVALDVGLGQLGAVKIALDKKTLVIAAAPMGQQPVGRAKDVVGKLLIVETMVTDVSIMTNKMSVVIQLIGGPSAKTITLTDEVPAEGESILFETFVLFKE